MAAGTSNISKMSDEELVAGLNVALGHVVPGVNFYVEELWRRETARREQRMFELTRTVEQLTWVVTSATIGALLFALIALVLPAPR